MKTLITLARFVAFSIDGGDVSCTAAVEGGEHPMSKNPITENVTLSAPLPKDRGNDAILAAFQAKFPDDTVQWAAVPVPADEAVIAEARAEVVA